MNERVDPFAILKDPLPSFTTKPRTDQPVAKETMERIAEENNFPSRQAPRASKTERRKPRTHRTGRNQQFNAKATSETIQRIYKLADEKRVPLGELLKQGMDALEAVETLQKLADRKKIPLEHIVKLASETLERAGVNHSRPTAE